VGKCERGGWNPVSGLKSTAPPERNMFAWRRCDTHWITEIPQPVFWCVHGGEEFNPFKGNRDKLWVPLSHDSISHELCNKR
jgi:hypothetical protein